MTATDLLGEMKHGHAEPIADRHYAWAVSEITSLRQKISALIDEASYADLRASGGLFPAPAQPEQQPVAYQFRQRSAVGKGPQSSLPWCDWVCIEREDYERYLREPNKLVQVRPLFAAQPPAAPVEADGEKAARDYEHGYNDGVEWAQTHGRCSADIGDLIARLRFPMWVHCAGGFGSYASPQLDIESSQEVMNEAAAEIERLRIEHDNRSKLNHARAKIIEECMDMLADVPGDGLVAKLTDYIGSYMALQIKASAEPQAVSVWQPIETAPKDGTRIDVWFQLTDSHGARWANVSWSPEREWWSNGPPSQYPSGGWTATHWMPFPSSPLPRPQRESSASSPAGSAPAQRLPE